MHEQETLPLSRKSSVGRADGRKLASRQLCGRRASLSGMENDIRQRAGSKRREHIGTLIMTEATDIFSYLRIFAGVCTLFAGFYYLLNRGDMELAEEQMDDDKAAAAMSPFKPTLPESSVPRTLPESPFTSSTNLQTLGQEIEIAADACARLNRTIGLVYFEFPALERIERDQGGARANALMEMLSDDFRRVLRVSDNVTILNRNQILVCICLLASRKDLETIASRLSAGARRRGLLEPDAPSLPVGLAIYPLDGRSGLELINSARSHYRQLTSEPAQFDAPRVASWR
jgi:hypothetical protein